ncbi:MAG: sugar phosphate isomerase/epimerase [Bacteroidetes bacterium]|nr:sugar phosphate isomerase/epimerase [Bacteroidota bacterium]
MLDLGFVSAILAEERFDKVIDFAADHGFKCVEVMCWPMGKAERRYAGVTHIDVTSLNQKKADAIAEILKKRGVYISGLGYYPNPLDPDLTQAKFFVDHLKKVIKAAHLLRIPVVNTFIGRDYTRSLSENFIRFKKTWPSIVGLAEDLGIKIGIENCPMLFTDDEWPGGKNLAVSPAVWDRMFEIIPSKTLGLNYDPSHMIWQMMDPYQPIYDYKDRLHHIHLKDAKIYQNRLDRNGILSTPLTYHAPKLPGLGDVNWNKFFAALTDVRYRGPVCIEVEDKAYEGSMQDIRSAILTSRNYLKQFLA